MLLIISYSTSTRITFGRIFFNRKKDKKRE